MSKILTTREVADMLPGVQTWQVRRLFELGVFKDPGRFAGKRAIPSDMLPAIIDELRRRGWLKEKEVENVQ